MPTDFTAPSQKNRAEALAEFAASSGAPVNTSKAHVLCEVLIAIRALTHKGQRIDIANIGGRIKGSGLPGNEVDYLRQHLEAHVSRLPDAPPTIVNDALVPSGVKSSQLTPAQGVILDRIASTDRPTPQDIRTVAQLMAQATGTVDEMIVESVYAKCRKVADERHANLTEEVRSRYSGVDLNHDLRKWARAAMADDLVGSDQFADVPERYRREEVLDAVDAQLTDIAETAPVFEGLTIVDVPADPAQSADRMTAGLAAGKQRGRERAEANSFDVPTAS